MVQKWYGFSEIGQHAIVNEGRKSSYINTNKTAWSLLVPEDIFVVLVVVLSLKIVSGFCSMPSNIRARPTDAHTPTTPKRVHTLRTAKGTRCGESLLPSLTSTGTPSVIVVIVVVIRPPLVFAAAAAAAAAFAAVAPNTANVRLQQREVHVAPRLRPVLVIKVRYTAVGGAV